MSFADPEERDEDDVDPAGDGGGDPNDAGDEAQDDEQDPARLIEERDRLRKELNDSKSKEGQETQRLKAELEATQQTLARLGAAVAGRATGTNADDFDPAELQAAVSELKRSTDPRDKLTLLIAREVAGALSKNRELERKLADVEERGSHGADAAEIEELAKKYEIPLAAAKKIHADQKASRKNGKKDDEGSDEGEDAAEDTRAGARIRAPQRRFRTARDVANRPQEMSADQYSAAWDKATPEDRRKLLARRNNGSLRVPIR